MSESEVHQLLPWYVNGTLAEAERAEFDRHLRDCEMCRREKEFLEKVRAQVDQQGTVLFEDHPTAERLVAAVRGELPEDQGVTIDRHLAVCQACSTEARWVRGEDAARGAASDRPETRRAGGVPLWLFASGIAATILLTLFLVPRPTLESLSGPGGAPVLLSGPERGAEEAVEPVLTFEPGRSVAVLWIDVYLRDEGFPFRFEILDESGATLGHADDIELRDLFQEQIYQWICDRSDFPPGRYTARITGKNQPPITMPFRVEP